MTLFPGSKKLLFLHFLTFGGVPGGDFESLGLMHDDADSYFRFGFVAPAFGGAGYGLDMVACCETGLLVKGCCLI